MCGYCTEIYAFRIVEALPDRKVFKKLEYFVAQDKCSLLLFHEYLCQEAASLSDTLSLLTSAEASKVSHLTIFCRTIETLMLHGFQSDQYQSLIQNPIVLESIANHQSNTFEHIGVFDSPEGNVLKGFLTGKALLDESPCYKALLKGLNPDHCYNLVETYLAEWTSYKDGSMKKPDSVCSYKDGNMKRSDSGWFVTIFPYVYLSLVYLREDEQLLLKILSSTPKGPPDQDAHDLWLQRKAIELLVKHHGIAPLIPYNRNIRPVYVHSTAVKLGLSQSNKAALAKALKATDVQNDVDYSSYEVATALQNGAKLWCDYIDV